MSYEGLLSLSTLLGDARPRGTPPDILSSLPKGTYEQWSKADEKEASDEKELCPICIEEVRIFPLPHRLCKLIPTAPYSTKLPMLACVFPHARTGSTRPASR